MILNNSYEYRLIINNPIVRDNLKYVFLMNYPYQEKTINIFSNLIGSFFEFASSDIFPNIKDIDSLKKAVSFGINYEELAMLTFETMQRSISLKEIQTTQFIVDCLLNDQTLMRSIKIFIDYGDRQIEQLKEKIIEEIFFTLTKYEEKFKKFGNNNFKFFENFEDNEYLNFNDITTIILKNFDLA